MNPQTVFFALLFVASSSFAGVGAADGCPEDDKKTNMIYYNTGNTKDGSDFQKNWKDVYQVLLDHAPSTSGSSEFSHGSSSDKVFGQALCVTGDCKGCLELAKSNFDRVGPLSLGASLCLKTTTNDICYLRYEKYSFQFNCVQSLSL